MAFRIQMIALTNKMKSLWNCNSGAVVSIELILVALIFIVGLIAGASALRDSFISEFVDTGLSVQNTSQSFSYQGVVNSSSSTAGSDFLDAADTPDDGEDVASEVVGVVFNVLPSDEEEEADLATIIENLSYTFRMTRFGSVWTGTGGFAGGVYSGSPFWPGTYTIAGTTITVILNPLSFAWQDGQIVLDASDPANMTGTVTWVHISGFVWTAIYELFGI